MHPISIVKAHGLLQSWQRDCTSSLLTFGKPHGQFVTESIPRLQTALQQDAVACLEISAHDASQFLAEDNKTAQNAIHAHDQISHLACIHALLSQLYVEFGCRSVPICLETVLQVHSKRGRALFFFEKLEYSFDSLLDILRTPTKYHTAPSTIAAVKNYTPEQIWTTLVIDVLRDLGTLHTVGLRHRNLAQLGCLRLRIAPDAPFGIQVVMTEFDYSSWMLDVEANDTTLTLKWNKADVVIETHEGVVPTDEQSYDVCQLLMGLHETHAFRSIPIARKLGTWLRDRGVLWDREERAIQKLVHVSCDEVIDFLQRHVSLLSVSARWALPVRFQFNGQTLNESIRHYRKITQRSASDEVEKDTSKAIVAAAALTTPDRVQKLLTTSLSQLQWHRCRKMHVSPSSVVAVLQTNTGDEIEQQTATTVVHRPEATSPGCIIS